MTRLRFDPSGFETRIERGTRVLDVTDEHPEADVAYSCRDASCGTCRVEVVQGAEAFASPEVHEASLLALQSAPSGVRLACQLRVAKDVPLVVLRKVEDETRG